MAEKESKIHPHEEFPEAFVKDESQEILISSYQNAMEDKIASDVEVS